MSKKVRMAWKEDLESLTVTGMDKESGAAVSFSWDSVSEENRPKLACFALKTILATRTSAADPEDKVIQMREVAKLLATEKWDKDRVGGSPTVSVLVEAIAKVKGISIPAAQKALARYDKDAKAAMEANPKVAKAMEEVKAARAEVEADAVDMDDLLS